MASSLPAQGIAAVTTRTPDITKTWRLLNQTATRQPNRPATATQRAADVQMCGKARICSQLRTCEQAMACLRLGQSSLDRDKDGIPCESLCQ
jgi:hypothetical protein